MNTLRKIGFGAYALLLGLTVLFTQSAFKAANGKISKFEAFTFYYHGPATYTISEVEDENNWSTAPPEDECSANDKACEITIDRSYVNNPDTAPTVKSTLNLTAGLSSASLARVTGSSDGSMTYANNQH